MTLSTLATSIRAIQASSADASEIIDQLNDAYIQSYLESDARAFDQLVADDFLVTLPDGRLLDKARFLELTAMRTDILSHTVEDVRIRVFGDAAIVNATTVFVRASGAVGETRYTDFYAKRGGARRAVAAHLTAVPRAG
jgi:ketosteroid isomerase-like protein